MDHPWLTVEQSRIARCRIITASYCHSTRAAGLPRVFAGADNGLAPHCCGARPLVRCGWSAPPAKRTG